MKLRLLNAVVAAVCLGSTAVALAQTSDKPFEENWAPTKWGKDDSAGSSNHTKNPANVKRALNFRDNLVHRLLLKAGGNADAGGAEFAIERTAARGLDRHPVVGPAGQQIEPRRHVVRLFEHARA